MIQNILKNKIIIILVCVFLLGVLFVIFSKDKYLGFYYPDKNDLSFVFESGFVFDDLEQCRDWVDGQRQKYNPDNSNYDYECGKNCDISSGKPYICEETLK